MGGPEKDREMVTPTKRGNKREEREKQKVEDEQEKQRLKEEEDARLAMLLHQQLNSISRRRKRGE